MNEKDLKSIFFAWLVGSLVLFLGPLFAPGYVVLGNDRVSSLFAPFLASFLIVILVKLLLAATTNYLKIKKSSDVAAGFLLVVLYIVSLWIVSKFALYIGFGISSFWVAVGIGIILASAEYWLSRLSSPKAKPAKRNGRKTKRRR